MSAFEFTFSEPFLIEAFRRSRQCRGIRRFATLLKLVLGCVLITLIVVSILAGTYVGAAFISVFLVFLVIAHRIDEWLAARRFRKSPFHDERIRIEISADGFTAKGTKSNAQLTWAAFTSARRFDDGFLLDQGPGLSNWLPIRAIISGNAQETDELIQANISDYKRA